MLGVHPKGHGSSVPGAQLSVGFGPSCPDYAQLAVAASAGWAWGTCFGGPVDDAELAGLDKHALQKKLNDVIKEAIRIVMEEKRCAVVDCVLESI